MNVAILENGNLLVTADNTTRSYIADELKKGDWWGTLYDIFEPYFTNGSYQPFDAGDGDPFVGLTAAPCIAESMTVEDDGTRVIEGRCWWFADYMLRDPLKELARRGRTIFQLAD